MARKRSSKINIENYVNGSPITPGVTYKLGDADMHTAWLLASSSPCLFKLSATAPTDEQWQACQVWARLGDIPSPSSPMDKVPAVLLTVEATGDSGVQKYLPLTNIPSSYSPIVVHYPSLTSSQKDDNHELTRTS